jgi:hypothetical protein
LALPKSCVFYYFLLDYPPVYVTDFGNGWDECLGVNEWPEIGLRRRRETVTPRHIGECCKCAGLCDTCREFLSVVGRKQVGVSSLCVTQTTQPNRHIVPFAERIPHA